MPTHKTIPVRSGRVSLESADGDLIVRTGVAGRAARMGHRLTISMSRWQVTVNWVDGQPDTAELTVEVDSLEVLHGEGGVKGLSGPERAVIRSNALKVLSANRFPEIRFGADVIERTADGYRLGGILSIKGQARAHEINLRTEDLGGSWRLSAESEVRQSDYGVKPFSMLMGALQVADAVTVCCAATWPKDR